MSCHRRFHHSSSNCTTVTRKFGCAKAGLHALLCHQCFHYCCYNSATVTCVFCSSETELCTSQPWECCRSYVSDDPMVAWQMCSAEAVLSAMSTHQHPYCNVSTRAAVTEVAWTVRSAETVLHALQTSQYPCSHVPTTHRRRAAAVCGFTARLHDLQRHWYGISFNFASVSVRQPQTIR